jgi:DNA-binding NarL/FixJ family response regulator
MRTRIVLVDDHELFRTGVSHALLAAGDFDPVGEAPTARAAFALVDATAPDLVLMDVSLPGMDGIIATREIRRRSPKSRVVIMSAHDRIHDVVDALDAGATGYILKSEGPETLLEALRAVARGDTFLTPALAERLATYRAAQPTPNALDVLSEREREVFRLAAECLPARDIARELCIARKTVDTHLNRIHRKLGSRTLAELVGMAARLGLAHTGLTRHQVLGTRPTPDLDVGAGPDSEVGAPGAPSALGSGRIAAPSTIGGPGSPSEPSQDHPRTAVSSG